MILLTIFNETSGRCLADPKTGGYLTFPTKPLAVACIRKNNLNPEHYEVRGIVENGSN